MTEETDITILTENDDIETLFEYINKNVKYVGFDSEWTDNNHVDLIQISFRKIANEKAKTYLIQTHNLMIVKCANFVEFLESKSILKLGVGIINDYNIIFKTYNIRLSGKIDLNNIYQHYNDAKYMSLSKLVSNVCGREIKKDSNIRCSNWNAKTLSNEQIIYAALDAYYGLEILEKIMDKNDDLHYMMYIYVDVPKIKNIHNNNEKTSKKMSKMINENDTKHATTKKLYDNYVLLDRDGNFLSFCNEKIFIHYQKLGCELLDDKTVKTNVVQKMKLSEYHKEVKHNNCVICGSNNNLMRHRVIPIIFMNTYAKLNTQRKLSQYCLIICINCQTSVHHEYHNFINDLFKKYMNTNFTEIVQEKKQIIRCRKLVELYKNNNDQIIINIVKQVKEYFKQSEDEKIDIKKVNKYASLNSSDNKYIILMNQIIKQYGLSLSDGDEIMKIIEKIEKSWCYYFLKTCKPQYLHKSWISEYATENMFEI